MEHKVRTKALSWLLTLAMVVGLLPGMALPARAATQTFTFTLSNVNSLTHNITEGTYTKDTKFVFNGYNNNRKGPNNGGPENMFIGITFKDAKGNQYKPNVTFSGATTSDWYNGGYLRLLAGNSNGQGTGPISCTFTLDSLPNDATKWKICNIGQSCANCGGGVAFDLVAVAEPSTNPTLSNTTANYDGSAHAISTSGGSGGTVKYATSDDSLTWSDWTTTVPSRTDTGTTYVKAKVIGDNFHTDSDETAVYTIVINEPATAPTLTGWSGTYDGQAHSVTATGAANGTVYYQTSENNSTWSEETTTAPSRTAAGTTYVKAYTKGDVGYGNSAAVNATIAISPKEVDLTWGDTQFTYNGSEQKPTATISGVLSGDDCTVTVTGAQTNAGGSYTATADSLSNDNYKLPTSGTTQTFTIDKKAVTVSGITAKDKVYDGNITAELDYSGVTIDGKIGSDDLTVTATGKFESAEKGTDKTVNISGLTLGGTSAGNYELAATGQQATATASITGQLTTLTAPTAKTLTYNGAEQALVTAGSIGTSDGTLQYAIGESAVTAPADGWTTDVPTGKDAKDYYVWYRVTEGTNYAGVAANKVTVTIQKLEAVLHWTNTAFAYDGNAHLPTATVDNLVTGDTCTVTVTGYNAEVGEHTAEARELSNANYKLPDAKTHTFTISGAKIVYGDGSAVTAPKRGETLKAVLVPTDTGLTYQWYRGDTPIDGATGETYTLTDGDVGKYIKVIIKKGETSYPSAPVGPVAQVHSIVVTVESDSNDPNTVGLKLMQGATQIGSKTTGTLTGGDPYTGTGTFENVPDGIYNIVATQGTKTVTAAVTLTAAETNKNVTVKIPSGGVNSELEVKNDGVPAVVAGGLDKEAEDNKEAGHTVTIKMTVEKEPSNTQAATEIKAQADATETAGKGTPTMTYLDITVKKTVDSTTTDIHETSDIIELVIPFTVAGRTIWMWRNHLNTVQALLNNTSHSEGTFWTDAENNLIHVYARKYSVYAIGYVAGAVVPAPAPAPAAPVFPVGGWTPTTLPTRYPVETEQTEHGTTEASHKEATAGTKVIITPKPDKSYEAASATVHDKDGKLVSVTKEKDGTWSFTMPASKVTVSVSYAKTVITPADTGVADWLITDDHIVYLNGYDEDGIQLIGPDRNITRAEVAMIFYRLLKNKDVTITKSFFDVPDFEWFVQAVGVLSSLGILNGYEEGDFRPQNPITRAEFTAIATRFAKATGGTSDFFDVPGDHWAYGNIATAADYGWVTGDNGLFRPEDKITRAEVAAIVNRMLGRKADQEWVLANPDKIKYFLDLQDTEQWYYFDMIEASNAHDFTKDDGVEKWK